MNSSLNSVQDNLNKEMNVYDIKFIKGLLWYILHDYYPGVYWKPDGSFLEEKVDSPYSVIIKRAIKLYLDENGAQLHSFYDEDFPCKELICNGEHLDILTYLKSVFEDNPFDNRSFLNYLCMCGQYTALSYLYGAKRAPYWTLQIISKTMQQMRKTGKMTRDLWSDFGNYCEDYVESERRRGYMKKPK